MSGQCQSCGLCGLFLPGIDVVEQVLPAVADVLQRVVDLCFFSLVAGCHELLSELLQVGFILTEQVHLLHAVLNDTLVKTFTQD